MASTAVSSSKLLITALFAASMVAAPVAGFQYEVGEEMGWRIPTRYDPETYNEWAAKNRFRIGDTVHFKYQKDSVLVVNSTDYLQCNTENPITKFEGGNTIFRFDRPGFFYFISGQTGHCQSGQRVIIRVMHPFEVESPAPAPSEVESPVPAPSAAAGGGSGGDGDRSTNWGPPRANATSKLAVVSYFMTAFAGFMVVFYLLV